MTGQSRCCTVQLLDRFPFLSANGTASAVNQVEIFFKLHGLLHLVWVAAQHVRLALEACLNKRGSILVPDDSFGVLSEKASELPFEPALLLVPLPPWLRRRSRP